MSRWFESFACLALAALAASAAAQPPPVLEIIFSNRPPHAYTEPAGGGGTAVIKGVLYERVKKIVAQAGLQPRFAMLPTKRREETIRRNLFEVCAMGVYKTPEREAFSQFTLSTFKDAPWPVISRADQRETINRSPSLQAFLRDTRLHAVLIDGLSHGTYIDQQIARSGTVIDRPSQPPLMVLKMLEAEHGDFTILPPDVFEVYRTETRPGTALRATLFPDVTGQDLYLMCSLRVPAATIARLNQAITALDAPQPPRKARPPG